MSAYGTVKRTNSTPGISLGARVYGISRGDQNAVAFVHLPGASVPATWKSYMYAVFLQELEDGFTYPQRSPMTEEEFQAYFLAYDVVIGLFTQQNVVPSTSRNGGHFESSLLIGHKEAEAETIACFYYIKPNYPGRSSHLCNAGFVVPPKLRGLGIGKLAGQAFLFFAPRLGYRGSVFNLVYATNEASAKIWDRLGFDRVGRIPQAGLMRKASTKDEHYVDAWVIHGDFSKLAPEAMAAAAVECS